MVGFPCACRGRADAQLSNGAIWAVGVLEIHCQIEPSQNACTGRSTYYSAIEHPSKSSVSGVKQVRDWPRPVLSSIFLRWDPRSFLAFCRPFPIAWFFPRFLRSIQPCGRISIAPVLLMNEIGSA